MFGTERILFFGGFFRNTAIGFCILIFLFASVFYLDILKTDVNKPTVRNRKKNEAYNLITDPTILCTFVMWHD
jgi:hypothetical protein